MRKTLIGTVVSDKRNKTRRVDVQRLYQHPKFGKIVRGRTICQVHDEHNQSHTGDTVEIAECPPRSRTKRWELVRVIKAASEMERQARQLALEAEAEAPAGGRTAEPAT
jgi:small subunit ribosomal protein S17